MSGVVYHAERDDYIVNDEWVVHHAERDDYIVVRFAALGISSESGCAMGITRKVMATLHRGCVSSPKQKSF